MSSPKLWCLWGGSKTIEHRDGTRYRGCHEAFQSVKFAILGLGVFFHSPVREGILVRKSRARPTRSRGQMLLDGLDQFLGLDGLR